MQTKYQELLNDRAYLKDVLNKGAQRASEVANPTLSNVKEAMGFPTTRWSIKKEEA